VPARLSVVYILKINYLYARVGGLHGGTTVAWKQSAANPKPHLLETGTREP
jgi:hypothetical protein